MDPFPLFLFLTGASPPTLAAFAELNMKTLKNINTNNTVNVHVDEDVDKSVVDDSKDTFFFIVMNNYFGSINTYQFFCLQFYIQSPPPQRKTKRVYTLHKSEEKKRLKKEYNYVKKAML